MRLAPALLLLAASPTAWAQEVARPTEVTLRSRPAAPVNRGGHFGLSFSLGPGFNHTGVHGGSVDGGSSGAAAVGSLRATLSLTPWLAVQVGTAGALMIAPTASVSDPALGASLESLVGFGLLGGGVVLGARSEGWQVSLLGGAAWTLIPIGGRGDTRTGAGGGGGVFAEVIHNWRLDSAWNLGLGASLWGLFGQDRGWIGNVLETPWDNLGGALLATVSTR